jgi:3-oxoacyl-[acyl-carrier-protein] synthase-3
MGGRYVDFERRYGVTNWIFDGQEIYRRAVTGMTQASVSLLASRHLAAGEIDLVVPHQANLRIIEAVAKRLELPMERVFVNVQRYGNMSAATVPVAMVEALEAGRIKPGALLLLPAFGAGLTWCAHLVRWGARTTALRESEASLPPAPQSALELVQALMRQRAASAS